MMLVCCLLTVGQAKAEDIPLNLIKDGDDYVVLLQDFMALLGDLYPESEVRWDIGRSQLNIKAQNREIEIYSQIPRIKLDHTFRQLQRPLYLRGERVMIPVQTVQVALRYLGVEFQVEGIEMPEAPVIEATPLPGPGAAIPELRFPESFGATPEPTPAPSTVEQPTTQSETIPNAPDLGQSPGSVPRLALPDFEASTETATPANTGGPAEPPSTAQETPAVTVEGAFGTSMEEMLRSGETASPEFTPQPGTSPNPRPTAPGVSLPAMQDMPMPQTPAMGAGANTAIQPPSALVGKIGLSWGQLADLQHRQPPSRVVLVCDRALENSARTAADRIRAALGIDVRVIPSPLRRRDKNALYEEILSNSPQLLIDLMLLPVDETQSDPQDMPFLVWAVHESLWPQDRQQGDPLRISQRYKSHQFQSLALGSLMRTELGRRFPDRQINYELAPSYLLRRIDAPSVALLIPARNNELTPDYTQRTGDAVFAAVAGYHRGMDGVKF